MDSSRNQEDNGTAKLTDPIELKAQVYYARNERDDAIADIARAQAAIVKVLELLQVYSALNQRYLGYGAPILAALRAQAEIIEYILKNAHNTVRVDDIPF